MPRGLPRQTKNFLDKSRSAALEAVASYNNPFSQFKTGAFIVHMQIAWTSLLLATLLKAAKSPYVKLDNGRFARINGRKKCLSLVECLHAHFGNANGAVAKNLLFLKDLRDMIEHDEMPELDPQVFGECQACLFNYEDLLVATFGKKYALSDALTMSVQLTRLKTDEQLAAIRAMQKGIAGDIVEYIQTFRSSLDADVAASQQFSFKVFLLPNVVANNRKDTLAVEFVKYDELTDDEKVHYDRLPVLIKLKEAPECIIKPGKVCEQVKAAVPGLKLNTNFHVFLAVRFGARPASGVADPTATKAEWAKYEPLNRIYGYSKAWVNYLIQELSLPERAAALYQEFREGLR